MTDQPVIPGGPIDPDNPPPPPKKPKGSQRDETNQENVGSDQSEGQAAASSSTETPNE